MRFASRLCLAPEDPAEITSAAASMRSELGEPATLVAVFASARFGDDLETITGAVAGATGADVLFGCTAGGVVGGAIEIEHAPAVSLWAAAMPGVEIDARHVEHLGSDAAAFVNMPSIGDDTAALILVADPFTFPSDLFCTTIDHEHPRLTCVGGLASGGRQAGETRLVLDGSVHDTGAVAVALSGAVAVRTLVSQGCRPIGRSLLVTAGERNRMLELGGRPAVDRLVETVAELAPEDRELIEGGLHIGRVVDEHKVEFGRGDFLIRNVVGIERDSGAVAIGDSVEVGSTVQFHVRDAVTADEDLAALLAEIGDAETETGVLVFTCNGRGRRFFGMPDHDAAAIRALLGTSDVGGFFCAGEIGPVGGVNHLHGYTAAVAVLSAP